MRVGVQGDGDAGVPEHFGYHLGVDVLREQDRRAGVAKIMEADLWEPGPLEEGLEAVRGDEATVQRLPRLGGEYEAVLAPPIPGPVYLPLAGDSGGS
jgi:hypothetical protein